MTQGGGSVSAPMRPLGRSPTTTFTLGGQWSLAFYPDNPISYNLRTRKWFVPLDLLFRQVGTSSSFSLGGAFNLGPEEGASYRYLINARLDLRF